MEVDACLGEVTASSQRVTRAACGHRQRRSPLCTAQHLVVLAALPDPNPIHVTARRAHQKSSAEEVTGIALPALGRREGAGGQWGHHLHTGTPQGQLFRETHTAFRCPGVQQVYYYVCFTYLWLSNKLLQKHAEQPLWLSYCKTQQ